jgi:leucyl aminopeptidase
MPLQIAVRTAKPSTVAGDILVLGVWTLGSKKKKGPPDALATLDRALGGGLTKVFAREEFKGKKDQSVRVPTFGKLPVHTLVVLGLGDSKAMTDAEARSFAGRAARAAQAEKGRRLVLALPGGLETRLRYVAEGLVLGAYRFDKYLTGERRPKADLSKVFVITSAKLPASAKDDVALGEKIAAAVNIARDLSSEPPNELPPAALAEAAKRVAKEYGLKVEVFDMAEIKKRGMRLIEAVGRGSSHEPRFVHLSYVPKGPSKKRLVFVGKGITFDTGGISIKPAAGMGEMKHDMSGAGNMVGLMAAVAALKPQVEVHALMACAENMPDGNAYRPGDVWPSLDGKSVEIINTDAEGRLVLADALAYGRKLDPDLMVDNATLTGACVVALGNTCSGFYATNDETANEFAASVKEAGEQMWRMPLLEELKDQLKSDVADLKHTGDRWGGSITAALFLREFIGDVKNWVHADIAGPVTTDRAVGWCPKGATGHGVLTYVALVERAERAEKTARAKGAAEAGA